MWDIVNRKDYLKIHEEILKFKALIFNFDGSCPNCKNNMTEFVSENKKIYLCEDCNCVYIPEDIRSIKISSFKYERYKGILTPVYLPPTKLQLEYLKFLSDATETEIDFDTITKEEAKVIIGMLKRKYDKIPLPKKEYNSRKPNKSSSLESMNVECVLNHMYDTRN